ncbi:hypothetical protein M409DRAFT_26126 [Zasmidium cellare ATCC 36951]|uniref:Uncharacterized protein n=1 Tax=Zasmidium cellare ATCC 36951 TaxID=1080233 RepID=A0A6A6C8P1_ZASCE|nr:uncharacterized protein M409DRAFT_26126 [Zasmidium cellare ATCC 36951]KAF2163514.1 hypothetical protein M409DRAFT_26126 [Zasmidium cellare ATCC 36951]
MSSTKGPLVATTARSQLHREMTQRDHDLRLIVGHANLLDALIDNSKGLQDQQVPDLDRFSKQRSPVKQNFEIQQTCQAQSLRQIPEGRAGKSQKPEEPQGCVRRQRVASDVYATERVRFIESSQEVDDDSD